MIFYICTKPFFKKMRLKDYYRTLEVSPSATTDEIRKSFRKLALKYHPDKNEGSVFSAAQFIEIKEAYHVLGDTNKRYKYDEERWLLGMSTRSNKSKLTNAAWIRGEAGKLRKHLDQIDVYRMSHAALQHYVLLLLSDGNIAVMQKEEELIPDLVTDVLNAIHKMKSKLMPPVLDRLKLLADKDETILTEINNAWHERLAAEKKEKYFPVYVLSIITILILAALFVLTWR